MRLAESRSNALAALGLDRVRTWAAGNAEVAEIAEMLRIGTSAVLTSRVLFSRQHSVGKPIRHGVLHGLVVGHDHGPRKSSGTRAKASCLRRRVSEVGIAPGVSDSGAAYHEARATGSEGVSPSPPRQRGRCFSGRVRLGSRVPRGASHWERRRLAFAEFEVRIVFVAHHPRRSYDGGHSAHL